jgi:hypothetical protein
VRHPGVELGRLAGAEDKVVVAEDQTHPAGEGEQPLVPSCDLGEGSLLLAGTLIFQACTPPAVRVRVTRRRARSCFSRGPTLTRAAAMAVVVSSTAPFHPRPSRKQQRTVSGTIQDHLPVPLRDRLLRTEHPPRRASDRWRCRHPPCAPTGKPRQPRWSRAAAPCPHRHLAFRTESFLLPDGRRLPHLKAGGA